MSVERPFAKGVLVSALAGLATAAFVAVVGVVVGRSLALLLALAGLAVLHVAVMVARWLAATPGQRLGGFARDLALTALGLVFAAWLVAPGLLGLGLAVWAFGLVQCLAFVGPPPSPRSQGAPVDAFEAARGRALAILEEVE